jgi:hypothetical protein
MDGRSAAGADPVTAGAVYVERDTCRACGGVGLQPALSLGNQFLPRFVKEADATLPRAPLDLCFCRACGLMQLGHTTNPELLFREFWYRSGINGTMRYALEDLVRDGLSYHHGGVWVDIGANDGYLLSCVPREFERVAFEPARNLTPDLMRHSDRVVVDYFKALDELRGDCDVITSAAMFYDLDEPGPFIDDIRDSLTPDGVWINQLNDAPTMLEQNAFDAICHEHLCYYDIGTLRKLYERHGMTITNISHNDVNGGSMRVTAMKTGPLAHPAPLGGLLEAEGPDFAEKLEDFCQRIPRWRERMLHTLDMHSGQTWCYGASTKGTVLLQYLGFCQQFEAVADRNPEKHGLKMVGSWLPIKTEEELRAAKPPQVLVLPWAFKKEFDVREHELIRAGTVFMYPLPEIVSVV